MYKCVVLVAYQGRRLTPQCSIGFGTSLLICTLAGSSRKLPGPGSDAKKKSLAELFQPPHDIMFHGSFHEVCICNPLTYSFTSYFSLRQARLAGEHKRKWLLVNVQDSKEFASQVLNRDVWSNHNVKDIIREYFIFWQVVYAT